MSTSINVTSGSIPSVKDEKTLHSYHIFLFPFKWEICQGKNHQSYPLAKRANINDIYPKIDSDYWEHFEYKPEIDPDGFCTYGEYAYFYEYTRDVLNLNPEYDGVNVRQYGYKGIDKESTFTFIAKGIEYELSLEDVTLNIYENGVGVLCLFLQNHEYNKKEDIFVINDFGRRIYPQFLGQSPLTTSPKGSFLASKITLTSVKTWLGSEITEDFSHYDSLLKLEEEPFIIPKHLSALLGESFQARHPHLQKGDLFIAPMIDDRMFTICIYYNQDFLNELGKRVKEKPKDITLKMDNDDRNIKITLNEKQKDIEYGYSDNQDWYKFIFVDSNTLSCHSEKLRRKHLADATYDRWIGYIDKKKQSGQLFGISRYSFVAVAAPVGFNTYIIKKHISHQYFQLVLLSLVQRAYVLNFSGEVSRISQQLSDNKGLFNRFSKEAESVSQLYLLYIKFVNRIFFREVTPQEQGIELYDLLQTRMRIREDVKDLGSEISELNDYADAQQQNKLTWVASRFLPPTLLAGIFGINAAFADKTDVKINLWVGLASILITFLISDFILNFIRFRK